MLLTSSVAKMSDENNKLNRIADYLAGIQMCLTYILCCLWWEFSGRWWFDEDDGAFMSGLKTLVRTVVFVAILIIIPAVSKPKDE